MNKIQLKRAILDELKDMGEGEFIEAYQNGCNHYNCPDDMIFPMDEFDEMEGTHRPFSEVYRDLTDDFSFNDEYYYLDGYAHYHSFNNIMDSDLVNVFEDLLDYAIDDEYNFESMKIAEIYEKAKEEEE